MTVTFTVLSSLPPPSTLRACHPCQSFLLSLIQFLCSQIRPQPTKIWVSKIFSAPLQPPSFQQEPAAQAGGEQAASSSPHLVVLSIGGKKNHCYSGFGSKQAFLVLLGEHYLLIPLAGLFLQILQYSSTSSSGSFSYPHFHPERKTYHAEFLLLWIERESIQKRTFKERAFGITFPLSTRFYREIGYFEPLLVLCSVVICENYIKLSTQSDPNKNRTKCSIYNVLLQSSSATITVII